MKTHNLPCLDKVPLIHSSGPTVFLQHSHKEAMCAGLCGTGTQALGERF